MLKPSSPNSPFLLHLGCGSIHGKNWVNVDGSLNVILDNRPWLKWLLRPILPASAKNNSFVGAVYMDLRGTWKVADACVDAIYSSHFFEHLDFEAAQHVLKESFRVLKPGGVIRFVLPSLESEVKAYLKRKKEGNALAASRFAQDVLVFPERVTGPWWYRLLKSMYDKNTHKWFYDNDSLAHYLAECGFETAEVRGYLKTSLPHLSEVEHQDRVENAVCVEARKPALAARLPKKHSSAA